MINPRLLLFFLGLIIAFSPAQAQEPVYEPFSSENIERIGIIASFEQPDFATYLHKFAVSDDGSYLAVGNGKGQLWYWELATGDLHILNAEVNCDCSISLDFLPNSTTLLRFGGQIWDLETDSLTDMIPPSQEDPYQWEEHNIAFDGSSFINLETGEIMFDLFSDGEAVVNDIGLSADGQYIAFAAHLYEVPEIRFTPQIVGIFDREGNGVSFPSGSGLDAIFNIEISPNSLYFAYNLEDKNIYIGHIPNNPNYAYESIEENIDTEIENDVTFNYRSDVFNFTSDSSAIVAINREGLWAFDIETETRSLLYEGAFYPYTIHKNLFAVAADDEQVYLFGVLPEP